jgi:hypothetical protein
MKSELETIAKWCRTVKARASTIGRSELAKTGEEFATSGDLKLDYQVAKILLDARQKDLPNYGEVNEDGSVTMARNLTPIASRQVQLLPILLFEIDWVSTAPGVSWPEAYYVTYVPSEDIRIVTASKDDDTIWGYPDLAIGMCKAIRGPEYGVKKILKSWWRRAKGVEPHIWEQFCQAGLIDEKRAHRWGREVLPKMENWHC